MDWAFGHLGICDGMAHVAISVEITFIKVCMVELRGDLYQLETSP